MPAVPSASLSAHRRAILLMLVSAASFTANVLLVRTLGAMNAANIWLVSVTRFVIGLIVVSTLYRREFQPTHLPRRKLAERGLVGALGVYLTYLTVVKIGAGRAIFIGNSYVIWGRAARGLVAARATPGGRRDWWRRRPGGNWTTDKRFFHDEPTGRL